MCPLKFSQRPRRAFGKSQVVCGKAKQASLLRKNHVHPQSLESILACSWMIVDIFELKMGPGMMATPGAPKYSARLSASAISDCSFLVSVCVCVLILFSHS
jgi:hypothetical protein